jgi:transmembrane sensor
MPKTDSSNDLEIHDLEDRAAELFLARRGPAWNAANQAYLDALLASDSRLADAYRRVEKSWDTVGRQATSPELMALREQAIGRGRQASAQRWSLPGAPGHSRWWAGAAGTVLACAVGWQLSPLGYRAGAYTTGLGEQKSVELADHSHITLDSLTRIRVRFTADARIVELEEGQAQFSVAKDPARPFKVEAGTKTIVAVGTVFDVEYVDRQVDVAMVEGRVAVLSRGDRSAPNANTQSRDPSIELGAGEGLRVRADGVSTVVAKADIEAATAWRQGKVIFRNETLSEAVHRLNRYSRQQVVIDDAALARMKVSGVFDAGDAQAFAEAMEAYLPVAADSSQPATIHLRMK